jgi:hypothetical protein
LALRAEARTCRWCGELFEPAACMVLPCACPRMSACPGVAPWMVHS